MTTWRIETGDVLEALRLMPDCSMDALLSDPPYGLGTRQPTVEEIVAYLTGADLDTGGDFMSKDWKLPSVAVWRECFRVLKPGAPVLAFGGTRMFDLLFIGLRAAGFECRDVLSWNYGSGFPKNQDVSKALDAAAGVDRDVVGERTFTGSAALSWQEKNGGTFSAGISSSGVPPKTVPVTTAASEMAKRFDGMGTALKPAWEPIVLARKPLDGTMVENVTRWGVGPIAIDACRIGFASDGDERESKTKNDHEAFASGARGQATAFSAHTAPRASYAAPGRWPANLLLSHADGCVPRGTRRVNGSAPGGPSPGHRGNGFEHANGRGPSPRFYADADGKETVEAYECVSDCPIAMMDAQSGVTTSVASKDEKPGYDGHSTTPFLRGRSGPSNQRADTGGASRFFFQATLSKEERCENGRVAHANGAAPPSLPAQILTDSVPRDAPLSRPPQQEDNVASANGRVDDVASSAQATDSSGVSSADSAAPDYSDDTLADNVNVAVPWSGSSPGASARARASRDRKSRGDSPARPTGEGAPESLERSERGTIPTLSFGSVVSPELPQSALTLSSDLASSAVAESPTDTTTITTSPSRSDGSVASATSGTTQPSLEAGARGYVRFKFSPKVSTFEREFGCDGLPERDTTETVQRDPESKGVQSPRAGAQRGAGAPILRCEVCGLNLNSGGRAGTACSDGGEHAPVEVGRGAKVKNHHVSLKPIALIKYLATLIKPPVGGRLLVPYSGAGSEMIGAMRAGWGEIVGIERDREYVVIAEARLKRWSEVPAHVDPLESKPVAAPAAQGALF